MDLLAGEQAAVDLFNKLGSDRVNRLLSMVDRRMQKRADLENNSLVNKELLYTPQYLAKDWEKDLVHALKLGIMLCTNPQYEAHQAILKRISERKARMAAKQAISAT